MYIHPATQLNQAMISEFQQLADKVMQLADLTASLRIENTELRRKLAELGTDNLLLTERIREAHARVSVALEQLPVVQQEAE